MKVPAHRRKKDPFRKQILGIRKPPPRNPSPDEHANGITDSAESDRTLSEEEGKGE